MKLIELENYLLDVLGQDRCFKCDKIADKLLLIEFGFLENGKYEKKSFLRSMCKKCISDVQFYKIILGDKLKDFKMEIVEDYNKGSE